MDRILTIPNAISAARLAGVPVFLWLVLGPRTATADYWAVALLIVAGLSDWLDGKIARALNQGSRLGEVLDHSRGRTRAQHTECEQKHRAETRELDTAAAHFASVGSRTDRPAAGARQASKRAPSHE